MPGHEHGLVTTAATARGAQGGAGPLRWFSGLSFAGRCLVLGGFLLFLICAVFAEENWRGKRDWDRCRRELEAKGALGWKEFVPPPVPDEQNFAATPLLAPLFDFEREGGGAGPIRWRDREAHDRAANFAGALLPVNDKGGLPPAPFDGTLTDLEGALRLSRNQTNRTTEAWPVNRSRADAATELLAQLKEYEPVLEELRSDSRRPHSRFNIEYDAPDPIAILLPHYLVLQRVTRLLEVRASSELALEKASDAFEDVQFMLRLANSIKDEPFLVGVAARDSMMKRVQQIIWEGLAGRNWSEQQLLEFQKSFADFRPLKGMDRGLKAERAAFGDTTFRYIRTHKNVLRMCLDSDNGAPLSYLLLGPNGWLYQEQITYQRLYDQRVLLGFDPVAGTVQPRLIDANREALEREVKRSAVWHHTGFSRLIFANLMRVFQGTAMKENRAHQTVAACALARYHLATGNYPENLDQLVPQFVDKPPVDVCDGKPLRYRKLPEGQFLLYSVGWNQKDDGGATQVMKPDGSDFVPKEGDWVWPQYVGK
jgi:hypothetical protein